LNKSISQENALTKVIKIGLIFWIKKQCKEISQVNIDLKGLRLGIRKSILSKVYLNASSINFKDIKINELTLEATNLSFSLNIKGPIKNSVTINKEFKIKANIKLNGSQIISTLKSKNWLWLNEWFKSNLLNGKEISEIKINNEKFIISASEQTQSKQEVKRYHIETIGGNLYFKDIENSIKYIFPIEESIYINKVTINKDLISIDITSNVIS